MGRCWWWRCRRWWRRRVRPGAEVTARAADSCVVLLARPLRAPIVAARRERPKAETVHVVKIDLLVVAAVLAQLLLLLRSERQVGVTRETSCGGLFAAAPCT